MLDEEVVIAAGEHVEVIVVPAKTVLGELPAPLQIVEMVGAVDGAGWMNCTVIPVAARSIIQSSELIKTGIP